MAAASRALPAPHEPPLEALRQHVEDVERRELDLALSRLAADGELTEARVEALEALSDALVDRVVPLGQLEAAARAGDRRTVETAVGLFVET